MDHSMQQKEINSSCLFQYLESSRSKENMASLKFNLLYLIEMADKLSTGEIQNFNVEKLILESLAIGEENKGEMMIFISLLKSYITSTFIETEVCKNIIPLILVIKAKNLRNQSTSHSKIEEFDKYCSLEEIKGNLVHSMLNFNFIAYKQPNSKYQILGDSTQILKSPYLYIIDAVNMEAKEERRGGRTLFLVKPEFEGKQLGIKISQNGLALEIIQESKLLSTLFDISRCLGIVRKVLNEARISLFEENRGKNKNLVSYSKICIMADLETIFKGALLLFLETSENMSNLIWSNSNSIEKIEVDTCLLINLCSEILSLVLLHTRNIFSSEVKVKEIFQQFSQLEFNFMKDSFSILQKFFSNQEKIFEFHDFISSCFNFQSQSIFHKPSLSSMTTFILTLEDQTKFFVQKLKKRNPGFLYNAAIMGKWGNLKAAGLLHRAYYLSGKKKDLAFFRRYTKRFIGNDKGENDEFRTTYHLAFNVDDKGIPMLKPNL